MGGKSMVHLLFPFVRAEVLRLLFTNRGQELYVRQIAQLSFLSLHTVQHELAKLAAAGLLVSCTDGYHRFYRANPEHRLYTKLRKLVVAASVLKHKALPLRRPHRKRL